MYKLPDPPAAPTTVVYRKHSYSPIRHDPKEDIPGPDAYYCKDDMVKEKKPAWVFSKEPKTKPQWLEDLDTRDYNVNLDAVRPAPTTAIIQPEHQPKFLGEEEIIEYSANYLFCSPLVDSQRITRSWRV